jgi:predicted dehydrogenase
MAIPLITVVGLQLGTLLGGAVVVLEAERGGATAVLEATSFSVHKEYSLMVETDLAMAEVGWSPPSLRIRQQADSAWREVSVAAPHALSRIQAGVDHFLECVAERREPQAGVADGMRALEVAAAAYQSVAEDRFVACGPGLCQRHEAFKVDLANVGEAPQVVGGVALDEHQVSA